MTDTLAALIEKIDRRATVRFADGYDTVQIHSHEWRTLRDALRRYEEALAFYDICEHCEGDGGESHTDNDVCGPASCSKCGGAGAGYDAGRRAHAALHPPEEA